MVECRKIPSSVPGMLWYDSDGCSLWLKKLAGTVLLSVLLYWNKPSCSILPGKECASSLQWQRDSGEQESISYAIILKPPSACSLLFTSLAPGYLYNLPAVNCLASRPAPFCILCSSLHSLVHRVFKLRCLLDLLLLSVGPSCIYPATDRRASCRERV